MKPALTFLTALFLAPLAALHAAEPKPANKPNVIVILSDDLGWADLSCYGSTFGDWKLIEWLEDDSAELFDLATDLTEKHDVAAQHLEIVRQLRERLHAWRKETGANMPRPKP